MVPGERAVHRQGGGLVVHAVARCALDLLDDAGVQAPPQAEGQSLVGGIAHQCPAEPQVTVPVVQQQPVQALPDVRPRNLGVVVQDPSQRARIERHPEHGGSPHDGPIGRREPVDLGHGGALDGVRQSFDPRFRRRAQQVQQERVAPRPFGDGADHVRGSGSTSHAASASAIASWEESDSGSMRVAADPTAGDPFPRRVTNAPHGRSTSPSVRAASRSLDASSR